MGTNWTINVVSSGGWVAYQVACEGQWPYALPVGTFSSTLRAMEAAYYLRDVLNGKRPYAERMLEDVVAAFQIAAKERYNEESWATFCEKAEPVIEAARNYLAATEAAAPPKPAPAPATDEPVEVAPRVAAGKHKSEWVIERGSRGEWQYDAARRGWVSGGRGSRWACRVDAEGATADARNCSIYLLSGEPGPDPDPLPAPAPAPAPVTWAVADDVELVEDDEKPGMWVIKRGDRYYNARDNVWTGRKDRVAWPERKYALVHLEAARRCFSEAGPWSFIGPGITPDGRVG